MSGISEEDKKLCFDLFDKTNSGSLDVKMAGVALRTLGCAPSNEELEEALGGLSSVDFAKFSEISSTLDAPTMDEVLEAFSTFDTNNNGYIPLPELKHLMGTLGEGLSAENLEKMAAACEPDSDNQVPYRHFVEVMMKDL